MLFLEKENVPPDEEILKKVTDDLKEMEAIPNGMYRVVVNDNGVHKESFEGYKDNSIKNEIVRAESSD
jgi:hypothetical protein